MAIICHNVTHSMVNRLQNWSTKLKEFLHVTISAQTIFVSKEKTVFCQLNINKMFWELKTLKLTFKCLKMGSSRLLDFFSAFKTLLDKIKIIFKWFSGFLILRLTTLYFLANQKPKNHLKQAKAPSSTLLASISKHRVRVTVMKQKSSANRVLL